MGIWYGPVVTIGSLIGLTLFGYFAKWLFVDLLKMRESKVFGVLLILSAIGFVVFLMASQDEGRRYNEPEPGIDYWMRP